MPDQPPTISDQLRAAVRSDGRSCFTLGYHACRPQLDPSLISRFVRGKRTLTLRSADSLARALGLVLVPAAVDEQRDNNGPAPPDDQGKNRGSGSADDQPDNSRNPADDQQGNSSDDPTDDQWGNSGDVFPDEQGISREVDRARTH